MTQSNNITFSNTVDSSIQDLSKEELLKENKLLRQKLEKSQQQIRSVENLSHIERLTKRDYYLEKIISTFNMPFLVIDEDLKIIYANSVFKELFKISETEGKHIFSLKDKDWEIPGLRQLLDTILDKKEYISNFQITHYFRELGQRLLLVNGQMESDESGQNLIMLSFNDITSEIEKQEIIEQKSNQLYFSIEAAQLGTYDYNPQTNKFSANHRLKQWFGVPDKEEIDLEDALKAIVEKDRERIASEIKKSLDPNERNKYDVVYNIRDKKNGLSRTVRAQGQAWFNEDNQAYRLNGTVEDITERTKIDKNLKDSLFRYNELIYSSPYLFAILKGENLIVVIANDAILETWGKEREVIGKPFLEVLPEMKGQGFDELMLNTLKTGESYQAFQIPASFIKNGEKVIDYFDFIYQPQKNSQGDIEGIAIIATNVTDRVKLDLQIKEEEHKFREMADLIPDKITNAGADGTLLYCNKSWLDFTGMTFEDLKNGKGENITHPDDVVKLAEARKKTFEKGIDLEIELRFRNLNGDYIWHLIRGKAMKDKSGKIISWLTATTEIQKLKEEQQKKEDFLKLVSHELKTPVTSIKGYTQLLQSMVISSANKRVGEIPLKPSLNRIETQIERLTRLISEILDLSRMENAKLDLKREAFSLNKLVQETVEDIKFSNVLNNLHIHSSCNCEIYADKDRIGQVLINFITNAIKYSPDNDDIHISVFHPNGNEVAVSVVDKGIGINPADQKNIFKRFYRVSGKNEETYAGFGIGLYLSYEIIQRHKGYITVDSELGKGSVFTLVLPHHN